MMEIDRDNTILLFVTSASAAILAAENWRQRNEQYGWTLNTGTVLLLTSVLQFIVGLRQTRADSKNNLLRSLQLTTCLSWLPLILSSVLRYLGLSSGNSPLPIYSFSVLASLIYLLFGILGKCNIVCLIAFLWISSWSLEIVNLYTHKSYQQSTAVLYSMLAAVTLFIGLRSAFAKVRLASKAYEGYSRTDKYDLSVSPLTLVLYFCHVLSSIPALFLLTRSGLVSEEDFVPSHVVSGIICLLCWISLLRHKDEKYHSLSSFLYGCLWLPSGLSVLLVQESIVHRAPVCFLIITFLLLTLLSTKQSIFHILFNFTYSVLALAMVIQGFDGAFFQVTNWLVLLLSLYAIIHYGAAVSLKSDKVPLGRYEAISKEVTGCFERIMSCCMKKGTNNSQREASDEILGFSKYLDIEASGFICNGISAVSLIWLSKKAIMVIAWIVPVGGLLQFVIGCVCISRGKTLQSCSFILFSMFWTIWGLTYGYEIIPFSQGNFRTAMGPLSFLFVGIVLCCVSLVISKAWFFYSVALLLNPILAIVFSTGSVSPSALNIILTTFFCLVCLYTYFAHVTKRVFGKSFAPIGEAFVNILFGSNGNERTVLVPSKRIRGVNKIADILNNGGIVALPTDTVYVLVAACKFPKAVERAYNTKKQAGERPMSLWISNLKHVGHAKEEFGSILWRFMQTVWPSSISLVVPKGAWLQQLGLGDSEKFIGKPDSIAVRMPDYTVTSQLIEQVGPIAVTSANPSGEADTTHHSQVLARLGPENCDGVLCDGTSPENAASTVVDCRKIEKGELGFFRIGIMPKSKVLELFEKVKAEVKPTEPHLHALTISPEACSESVESQSSPDIIPQHDQMMGQTYGSRAALISQKSVDLGVENPAFSKGDT